MSGGYFDYNQYKIDHIADEVDELIIKNGQPLDNDEKKFLLSDSITHYKYPDEVIEEFKKGLEYIKKAAIYTHRIDWLVSGDDGEDSFLRRLKDDLKELNK